MRASRHLYPETHPMLGSAAKHFVAFFLVLITCLAQADRAVVVGVQEYAPLISASTLRGCINDANAIKDILDKNHFAVTLLTNEEATRAGILKAIADCAKSMKRDERFVFYFAGHGRRNPHPAIMPHDATGEGNDLTTDDLNAAILKVPARSRTIILDACFSGGMAAGEMARGITDDGLVARFWEPPAEQSRSLHFGPAPSKANNQDSNAKLENGSGICYYTACTSNEQALEGTFDNQRHGLFTYALISNLKDDSKPWGEVHNEVKTEMQQKLEKAGRQQNPTISKEFINAHALDNDVAKPVPPKPTKALIDVWNLDNSDAKKIALEFQPNQTGYEAGRKVHLTINVGQPGYLVVLGQVDGHFYQFWPQAAGPDASAVKAGKIEFPLPGQVLFFDTFGADQVKAILFSDPDKARQVIDAMREAQGGSAEQIAHKDLVMARSLNEPEYTSRVSVAVSDNLVGGLRFKDLEGLMKKVARHDDPVSQVLWRRMSSSADTMASDGSYPKAQRWMADFDPNAPIQVSDRQEFVTIFNLLVQSGPLYDDEAFAKVKLSSKTKDLMKKKPTGDDLLRLNRMLLVDAYPNEVNPDDAGGSR